MGRDAGRKCGKILSKNIPQQFKQFLSILAGLSEANQNEYEPAIYMFEETAEIGVLLKEYCCVHASQVNYDKPSYCNKIIRGDFNESFHI